MENILGLKERSFTLALGTEVHRAAERILTGKEYSMSEKAAPLAENLKKLLDSIDYDDAETEVKLSLPLSSLGFASELLVVVKIDAVFRKGEQYLIVDWKTDRNTDYGAKHRQQLELYRRVFSLSRGVPVERIKVAIGYVGLRSSINTGSIRCGLDGRDPAQFLADFVEEGKEGGGGD